MPSSSIIEVSFFHSILMTIILFGSIFLPMLFLPRLLPVLILDANKNTTWIDGLRGVAAALVGINHAPLVLINLKLTPLTFYFSQKVLPIFGFFGSLGVQLFFCITGMLFSNKILFSNQPDWPNFYRKRIFRIVPAYVAACILAILIAYWYNYPQFKINKEFITNLPHIFSFGLTPLPTFDGFSMDRLLGIVWTLGMEWRFYAMLPIVYVLIRDLRIWAFILISVFAVADSVLTDLSSWVFFLSGAICAPLIHKPINQSLQTLGYGISLASMIILCFFWQDVSNYGPIRWGLITILFVCMTVTRPRILLLKPLIGLGAVSYSFYLLHCMLLFFIFDFFYLHVFDVTKLSLFYFTLFSGAVLAFITIFSTVSYIYIERSYMHSTSNVSRQSANRYNFAS